jgi:hypothetical protein
LLRNAPEATAKDEECDRSVTATSSTPPNVDSSPAVGSAADEEIEPVCPLTESEQMSDQQSDQNHNIDIDNFDGPVITLTSEKTTATCADSYEVSSEENITLCYSSISY